MISEERPDADDQAASDPSFRQLVLNALEEAGGAADLPELLLRTPMLNAFQVSIELEAL